MSTFRVNKNVNYTVMSNHHLQDKRLSLKAKGLLSYMLSLPDDWDYSLKGLTVGCKDGLDSVRTAVLELEEHGYVRCQKVRNAKGQIIDYDYQVYESPVEDDPAVPGKEGEPSDPSATKSPKSRMKPCSSPFLDFPNLRCDVQHHPAYQEHHGLSAHHHPERPHHDGALLSGAG